MLFACWAVGAAAVPPASTALPLGPVVDRTGEPVPPWVAVRFPRVARPTTFRRQESEGSGGVRAIADCSASALFRVLEVDPSRHPRLRWRWRVDVPLAPADERLPGHDDFAARVYVTFAFDPNGASLWRRARNALAGLLYDHEIPGEALNYVYASGAPLDATWENPVFVESTTIVLRSGTHGVWHEEEIDFLDDYRRFFGRPAPPVHGVALMADSDDRCVRAEAVVADLELVGR